MQAKLPSIDSAIQVHRTGASFALNFDNYPKATMHLVCMNNLIEPKYRCVFDDIKYNVVDVKNIPQDDNFIRPQISKKPVYIDDVQTPNFAPRMFAWVSEAMYKIESSIQAFRSNYKPDSAKQDISSIL